MISAGIRELKNNLSRYLSRVKNGEDILITERGKAIARINRKNPEEIHLREVLSPLVVKGLIKLPGQKIIREISAPVKLPGKSVSEMVIEVGAFALQPIDHLPSQLPLMANITRGGY